MALTDKNIVSQVIAGQHESYGLLIDKYQNSLIRYAQTITKDSDMAADAVQESFIKAYRNLNGYNQRLKFSSWLYRIVHNEAINILRRNKRQVYTSDDSWIDNLPDERQSITETLDITAEREVILRAVSELPAKYKQVIILHFLEAKSYQEISDILQIPTSSVGTRLRRAKAKLQPLLQQRMHREEAL